ncbi:MAG: hypothetical protein GX639_02955 [Fibrobacter sp.]|mgnify:FL=1|nr:hypothetical protein [Fibrobacter sp.]
MKISLNNYPILRKVKNGLPLHEKDGIWDIHKNGIDKIEKHGAFYDYLFQHISADAKTNNSITYISSNILKMIEEQNIPSKLLCFLNEIENHTGIFLFKNKTSTFYNIVNNIAKREVTASFMLFNYETLISCSTMIIPYLKEDTNSESYKIEITYSNDMSFDFRNVRDVGSFYCIVTFLLFRKFADHEFKLIDGLNKKKEAVNGSVYKNESELPINIFDSRWFTTVIRDNGFNVSGHFRLQPCGPEKSLRKLIWINEFQKPWVC